MTGRVQTIELHKKQLEFFASQSKYTVYSGGVGSGKTFVGAFWAVSQMLAYPKAIGLITANTHSQLRKAALPQVFDILDSLGIPFRYKENKGILIVNGSIVVYCWSMEKHDNLRGPNAGWCWSDECSFYSLDAFNVIMGRIRDKKGSCQWKGTTTPNGYNWLYDKFVAEPLKNSTIMYGSSNDNALNLDEDYLDTLHDLYDARLAEQELEGKFVNSASGLVYHAFNRRYNYAKTNDFEKLIILGLDFNVNPLCGVFCYNTEKGLYATQELYLKQSNTFKAAKEIQRRYPDWRVKIVPDETGNRRKTSSVDNKGASRTDHKILTDAGLTLIPFKNPLGKDRINNMNRLFHHQTISVDRDNCPMLTKDLEALTWDNKDEMLGHLADGLGYVAWHLYPMKKPKRKSKVHYL